MLTKRRVYMQGRPAMSVFLGYRFVLLAMAVVLGAWPVARAFAGPLTVHVVTPQATATPRRDPSRAKDTAGHLREFAGDPVKVALGGTLPPVLVRLIIL
jgi:hypothetical protein